MLRSVPNGLTKSNKASEAQMLRTLNAFAVDLMSIPSTEDLFWYVAQNVVGKLGFVDCVIYRANDTQTELTQVSAWGEKNPFGRDIINPLVIPFGRGITGQVAQSRKPIVVSDLLNDQDYIADTQPARSEICVPLIADGRVVGAIDSEHPEAGAFGDRELEILSTVAAMTSAKLELLAETVRSKDQYEELVVAHSRLTQETNTRKALEEKLFEARKLESIGRLTGRFAHEFNNLLTVIAGNLDLMELDWPDGSPQDTLDSAKSASSRGSKLISDMLAFAQRVHLTPEPNYISAHISAFLERCEPALSKQIEVDLAADPWMVSVDSKAMQEMISNLVSNGFAAMPDGGTLKISTENVFYTLSDARPSLADLVPGRYVCLRVCDEGTGISEQHLSQIFDPFFTTKKVGDGTGLGLSMVMGVMRQSGGIVQVESTEGQGAGFKLYFPAVLPNENELLTISR
jgi:signal transduction histidine kinase